MLALPSALSSATVLPTLSASCIVCGATMLRTHVPIGLPWLCQTGLDMFDSWQAAVAPSETSYASVTNCFTNNFTDAAYCPLVPPLVLIPLLQVAANVVLTTAYQGPSAVTCLFIEVTPTPSSLSLCSGVSVAPGSQATCTVLGRNTPGSYQYRVGCSGVGINITDTINVQRIVPTLELTGDGTATTGGSRAVTARAFLPGAPDIALGNYPVTFSITSGSGSLSPLSTATAAAEDSLSAVVERANTLTVTTLANGIAQALVSSNQAGVVAVGGSLQVGSVSIPSAFPARITFAPGQVAVLTLRPHTVETDY